MKVGIYGQFYHEGSGIYIQQLLEILDNNSVEVVIEKDFLELIQEHKSIKKSYAHFSTFEELDTSYDLFFSIGGDGTILKSVTYVRNLGIPIAGINTGRLGFLATIRKEALEESVYQIFTGNYTVSSRNLLQITSDNDYDFEGMNFALNEITVSRKNTTSMITVHTNVNGEFLTSYWADGLIVSTPTGSTGYSLSCGGPVVMPNSNNFIIAPVCPHNLNVRPIVVPADSKISFEIEGRNDNYMVTLDSRAKIADLNTTITLTKEKFTAKIITTSEYNYLKTLRNKLSWGNDVRN